MGQSVAQVAKDVSWGVAILAGLADAATLNNILGDTLRGPMLSFPLYTLETLPEGLASQVDCIVDFSSAAAIPSLLAFSSHHKIPLVLCTTGLSDETQALVVGASQRTPIFQSGNMSYGINLLEYVLKMVSGRLSPRFDVEIIERHHRRKVDAPSGTALMLSRAISTAVPTLKACYGRSGLDAKRQPQDITIHAVRGGTIVGQHEVLYAGPQESLTFTHEAQSREVFAEGALRAAHYIVTKSSGLYTMQNLIDEESPYGSL